MPPRHVGVHGCFPEPWQSSAACRGASESPTPKMLPGPSHAIPQPWCFCSARGWSKPKARPGAAGDCACGAQGACNSGWAGPGAPESPSAPTAVPQGASAASPASHRRKDAELGRCLNPGPITGTQQGIPLRPKSGFIITARPPCKQIRPRWVPLGRFWGELHPAELRPAGMGEGGACFGNWTGARAGGSSGAVNPGPRRAAPAPAHSVPASAGMATSCACHRPRWFRH